MLLIWLLGYLVIGLFGVIRVDAAVMTNGSVELNIEQTTPTPVPPNSSVEPAPAPANVFEGSNYIADETDSVPLTLQSGTDVIDYGVLSATNPVVRTASLSVLNPALSGFEVIGFENHPLSSSKQAAIEDTTCDNGLCRETNSSLWLNTLSFGFGYRCDGFFCAQGFENNAYFKQFPSVSGGKLPQVMYEGTRTNKASVQILYKVNVSGTQDLANPYQNTITFIAVPNL